MYTCIDIQPIGSVVQCRSIRPWGHGLKVQYVGVVRATNVLSVILCAIGGYDHDPLSITTPSLHFVETEINIPLESTLTFDYKILNHFIS